VIVEGSREEHDKDRQKRRSGPSTKQQDQQQDECFGLLLLRSAMARPEEYKHDPNRLAALAAAEKKKQRVVEVNTQWLFDSISNLEAQDPCLPQYLRIYDQKLDYDYGRARDE
jgi:hypothetical protein